MATRQVASELAKAETEKTGTGPIAGGPAATAQSQMTKEKNLADKVADVQGKAADEISQKDARELQSKEDRALGSDARTSGSLAAEVQSQADKNTTR